MGTSTRLAGCVAAVGVVGAAGLAPRTRAQSPSVLLVGPAGAAGAQYASIQDAVKHARPGDWVSSHPASITRGAATIRMGPQAFSSRRLACIFAA